MIQILSRLRAIELEVLSRPSEGEEVHLGSIKFMPGQKRPNAGPRIPSFGVGVGSSIRHNDKDKANSSPEDSDDELMEAVLGLQGTKLGSEMSEDTTRPGEYQSPVRATATDIRGILRTWTWRR